jgi:site-specific DNA-cytosine methylase
MPDAHPCVLLRLVAGKPSQHVKPNLHPQPGRARVISVAERKRLQGMPDRLELRVSPACIILPGV